MTLRYAIVIEQPRRADSNYGAFAPDVPGCVSVGDTLDEMRAMMREAIEFHLEGVVRDGDPFPHPTMTLEDAEAYRAQPLSDEDLALWFEAGGTREEVENAPPPIIEWLEVDVAVPEGAR